MRKSSANFIWCITYTTEGKICGKMAGMNIVASGCHSCRHRETGFASGVANCFLTGVENQGRRFKTLRKKSLPGRTEKWRRFCKVCKCGPPFSVKVPRHNEKNFRPSVAGRSENANGFGSFSSECRSFILCNHCTKAENISGKMAAMKVMVRSRCPCRHLRSRGSLRCRESCVGNAQAVRANPIGSLMGSVGLFHFVPVGHLWPTNLGYDAAK